MVKVRFKYGLVQCTVCAKFVVTNIELSDSDGSEENDGGDASYFIDSPVDGTEMFSLRKVVSETPVVELASCLQFNYCQ